LAIQAIHGTAQWSRALEILVEGQKLRIVQTYGPLAEPSKTEGYPSGDKVVSEFDNMLHFEYFYFETPYPCDEAVFFLKF